MLNIFKRYFYWNKKKKTVCYTYVSDGYDDLINHRYVCKNWEYICFTNNPKLLKRSRIGIWKIVPSKFEKLDSKRNSGWHKTHPHILFPEYDVSVWVDANVNILTPYLSKYINIHNDNIIITPLHFRRDCIYDEVQEVRIVKYDSDQSLDNMLDLLNKARMPKHYGLNETNIMFRRHNTDVVKKIDSDWWNCIENYSARDQCSFNYVLFKNNINISDISIPNARFDTKNFKMSKHNKHHSQGIEK